VRVSARSKVTAVSNGYHICFDHDIIVSKHTPSIMSDDNFNLQIRWQSNDFNVSMPSCTSELGKRLGTELGSGEELTGALRSWGELGRAWQRRGAELGRGEVRSLAEARSEAWQRRGAD
jgi:hypothetical protein